MHHARSTILLVTVSLVLGCANSADEPTGPKEPNEPKKSSETIAEEDGLRPLPNTGFRHAWARPGSDLGAYDRVLLAPARVAYRREPTRRRASTGASKGNFALDERQMETLKRYLHEALASELNKSEHYELVDPSTPEPSPAAPERLLLIEPAIMDLVVNVPTERGVGNDDVFTNSTAEMTLRLELRDADSREVLLRIEERQTARQAGRGPSDLYRSNPVTDSAAVRSTFRRWARILRARLDSYGDSTAVRG